MSDRAEKRQAQPPPGKFSFSGSLGEFVDTEDLRLDISSWSDDTVDLDLKLQYESDSSIGFTIPEPNRRGISFAPNTVQPGVLRERKNRGLSVSFASNTFGTFAHELDLKDSDSGSREFHTALGTMATVEGHEAMARDGIARVRRLSRSLSRSSSIELIGAVGSSNVLRGNSSRDSPDRSNELAQGLEPRRSFKEIAVRARRGSVTLSDRLATFKEAYDMAKDTLPIEGAVADGCSAKYNRERARILAQENPLLNADGTRANRRASLLAVSQGMDTEAERVQVVANLSRSLELLRKVTVGNENDKRALEVADEVLVNRIRTLANSRIA